MAGGPGLLGLPHKKLENKPLQVSFQGSLIVGQADTEAPPRNVSPENTSKLESALKMAWASMLLGREASGLFGFFSGFGVQGSGFRV